MRDPVVTSRIMSAVKSRDTQPEMLLRRELHRRGMRYRLHQAALPGRPDIVFTRARVAVFVDGTFWHGGGWRERGFESMEAQFTGHRDPKRWVAKIRRNMERDVEVNRALRFAGWEVVRIAETEIRRDVSGAAERVASSVGRRKGQTAVAGDRTLGAFGRSDLTVVAHGLLAAGGGLSPV